MKKDIIAIVGMGNGGRAILETIMQIPEIFIKAVYDNQASAPGLAVARQHNIPIIEVLDAQNIVLDSELEFIFEVTGNPQVYEDLKSLCRGQCTIIGAATTKIIFHLLDAQQTANDKLAAYKNGLELAIIQRTEELEKANRQLEMKILDHERLNEKLQRINDEKTRYLLQATHQLKAPFAAIQSYTDIILQGYTGELPEPSRQIVAKIKQRCQLLSNSIKEMLELANLKSALSENISMQSLPLNQLLCAAVEQAKIIAASKQIVIHFSPSSKEYLIRGNEEQIKILFNIFLENAIQYSYPQGQIHIEIHSLSQQQIAVYFKDEGIGIAPTQQEKIFEEYYRTNESVAHHADGTGLGLSIAKRIMDLHGYYINIDSSPGEGSCFILTLRSL